MSIAGWMVATALSSIGYADESQTPKTEQPSDPDPRMDCPKEWLDSIQDDSGVMGAKDNRNEYLAYDYFVQRARQFSLDDLAKRSRKELTYRRLFEEGRGQYRGEIVHVEGKLKRLTSIGITKLLENAGIKKLYEAWIFGAASVSDPTCVILSELPAGLEPGEDIRNVWITCDGYFFKRYAYESAEVDEKTKKPVKRLAPLIIARTAREILPEPSQSPEQTPRMDCPSGWLDSILDDSGVMGAKENRNEYLAYSYFVQRARQFSPEELATHTRKELTFRRLFDEGRGEYRGEIVHVQGRLKRLTWIGSNKLLENAGIKNLYEAWIFDAAYFSNPTCVILSELPPGLEPGEDIRNVWVSCDGYFFKRYLYETPEVNAKTKSPVKRLAPLVIGRTATVIQPEVSEAEKQSDLWSYFVPVLIAFAFGMIALALVLHRWFMSGDRKAYAVLQNAKQTEFIAPTESPTYRDYPQEPSAN